MSPLQQLICLFSFFVLCSSQDVYDGCGETKGCTGFPRDCITTQNCTVLGTWARTALMDYAFEIYGSYQNIDDLEHYIAIGVSTDATMGDDSVVACAVRPQPGIDYSIDMYFNSGTPFKVSTILEQPKYGISNPAITTGNSFLHCSFNREAITVVNGITFDLDHDPFYVLLATGLVNDLGELRKHQEKAPSAEAFDLSAFGPV